MHRLKASQKLHYGLSMETYHYKHQIFIVMEHCSGGDLYSRDPYTEEEAAQIESFLPHCRPYRIRIRTTSRIAI